MENVHSKSNGGRAGISGPAFLAALALSLGSASAGSWSSGSGFTWLNPTSDKLGVGMNTTPAEKFQVVGGSVLIDQGKNYKGKTNVSSPSSINLIGANGTSAYIYDGKIKINSAGNVGIGAAPTAGFSLNLGGDLGVNHINGISMALDGDLSNNGNTDLGGPANIFGNTTVFGNLSATGIKPFIQPHPTDPSKKIVYVAAEAGQALTLVRANAKTAQGTAGIRLPADFGLVTSPDMPLTVQVTVKKVPALLYVTFESKDSIEVKMKGSDFAEFGDAEFSYFVQGIRDSFEDHKAIQDVDAPEGKVSEKQKSYRNRVEAMKSRMKSSRSRH